MGFLCTVQGTWYLSEGMSAVIPQPPGPAARRAHATTHTTLRDALFERATSPRVCIGVWRYGQLYGNLSDR